MNGLNNFTNLITGTPLPQQAFSDPIQNIINWTDLEKLGQLITLDKQTRYIADMAKARGNPKKIEQINRAYYPERWTPKGEYIPSL